MSINRNLSFLAEGASSSGVLSVTKGGTGLTTLTAGYIPYGNGTSALSSSSNLYFDGTNLGVGTTSPYSNAAFATLGLGGSGSSKTGLISLVTAAGVDSAHIDVYDTKLRITTNGTTNPIVFYTGGSVTEAVRISSTGGFSVGTTTDPGAGLISDQYGNLRSLPLNSQTSAYVVAASDNGKVISITTGGVTINNSIMSAGMVVTIYNNSGSSQTITQGTGVTLQWAGQSSSTTGNRTLGLYGMATVYFLSASSAVITGSGLT